MKVDRRPEAIPVPVSTRIALELLDHGLNLSARALVAPVTTAVKQHLGDAAARGIHVQSMRNKANRLEELFIRLVEPQQERVA